MLHEFDAGKLAVHMGLSTADLTLESLNSYLFLLEFSFTFSLLGTVGAPWVGCWETCCTHGALHCRFDIAKLEFLLVFT